MPAPAPACIYLVSGEPGQPRTECGRPATHYLQRPGSSRRRYYCATHAEYVRRDTFGKFIIDPL